VEYRDTAWMDCVEAAALGIEPAVFPVVRLPLGSADPGTGQQRLRTRAGKRKHRIVRIELSLPGRSTTQSSFGEASPHS
jgi:hypothetical protein